MLPAELFREVFHMLPALTLEQRDMLDPVQLVGHCIVLCNPPHLSHALRPCGVQFDALNSFGARRSEIWVDLEDHPWK